MRTPKALAALTLILLGASACQARFGGAQGEWRAAPASEVPPPLKFAGTAYDHAAAFDLPAREALEGSGLLNVFHLSEAVISGSEPHGRAAFKKLAALGVRTVISVDGKLPEVALAGEFGLRYVHIPIQYSGIDPDQRLRLAKTFRELAAPFYVHCFHGRHRGPAAAALGRVVLDGVARTEAIAEMRQYSRTSSQYEGLYSTIATGDLPGSEETAAFGYSFAAEHQGKALVEVMVSLSRAYDSVEQLSERDWRPDPEHPDLDALNEAETLRAAYRAALHLDTVARGSADQRGWFGDSHDAAERLTGELAALKDGDFEAGERALVAFKELKADCRSCHLAHRN
ncbi:MAG TPA: hypothetical protein EYG30_05675 [Planctomycetes bacterium]|jgi:protein tyrosine phosphatase (PTP) superfamily phosphohydrolase (DUF442 family)|nr:hypothetical protein [Planctomycetota bacterium]HIL51727.1 hypothetical protein [Planctomycetota bacterium]